LFPKNYFDFTLPIERGEISLREQVIGLSVPSMPIGSPGMEISTKRDKFNAMLILKNG
jgi:hypothetical protein